MQSSSLSIRRTPAVSGFLGGILGAILTVSIALSAWLIWRGSDPVPVGSRAGGATLQVDLQPALREHLLREYR